MTVVQKDSPDGEGTKLTLPKVEIGSDASDGERNSENQPKFDEATLASLAKTISPMVAEALKSTVTATAKSAAQSMKDVRWNDAAPTLDKLKGLDLEAIAAVGELYKQANGDAAVVERELALQQIMAERRSNSSSAKPETSLKSSQGDSGNEMESDIIEALEPFGLPQAVAQKVLDEWGASKYPSMSKALASLNKIATKAKGEVSSTDQAAQAQATSQSAAGVIAPAGGVFSPKTGAEKEARAAVLREKLSTEYFKAPSKYAKEILETKKELGELGDPHFSQI
jgi:hypothetical protein